MKGEPGAKGSKGDPGVGYDLISKAKVILLIFYVIFYFNFLILMDFNYRKNLFLLNIDSLNFLRERICAKISPEYQYSC